MMMFPADVALASSRNRRRASTSARKRALTEGKSSSSFSSLFSTGSRSFSGRRSALGVDDKDGATGGVGSALPPAIALLEQVNTSFSVTKHQSDVRYVMTVHHGALRVAWRHARSFDEYRKLQQRLLKVLNHGHFCDADCPWLFTFLKSYFPKKHLFNFGASARVIDARKETLARFFSTLQGFLLNRANHVCAVMTSVFAAELVAFIYGDALQQHGVGDIYQLLNSQGALSPLSARGSLSFSMRKSGSSMHLDSASMASFADDEASTVGAPSTNDDDYCALCDSSLAGEAFASSQSLSLTVSSSSPSEDDPLDVSSLTLGGSLPASSSMGSFSRGNSARSAAGRPVRRYYITTLSCGHQFHDECIVPKLNESMTCPTCGHLETSS